MKAQKPEGQWLVDGVRELMPEARRLVLDGLENDGSGIQGVVDAARGWESVLANKTADQNEILTMLMDSTQRGFVLGVAYALALSDPSWLKGGVR